MKTIQAAELRKNMDSYLKRAASGEKFKVTYRGKSLAVLIADEESNDKPNAPAVFAAAKAFNDSLLNETKDQFARMTDEDIKRLRDDHMKDKYGV